MAVLEYHVPPDYVAALKAAAPDLDLRSADNIGDPAAIEMVLFWLDVPDFLADLPNLRLVQSMGAGAERLLVPGVVPPAVAIARVSNAIQCQGMSDYVILHVLRQHRRLGLLMERHRRHEWQWQLWPRTADVTVGILGLGALGSDAARKLAAIGFQMRGWSRMPKSIDGIDCFHGDDQRDAFLSACDHLVCLLPLTEATRNILSADLFGRLPHGAFLINAGRGGHLVEADLLTALDSGQIAGATLDVMREEPVPADHPFWDRPEILITPHSAVCSTPEQLVPSLLENIRRNARGEPLMGLVDRDAGY